MTRKFIGFSANNEYIKKVDELQQHLSKYSIAPISRTELLKYAIDQLYKDYKEGN